MKWINKSKKIVLQKTVLIFNRSKTYIDEKQFARNTISCKSNCQFDKILLI